MNKLIVFLCKDNHTDSQDSWGWQGPLEVICFHASAQAGRFRTGCSGLCPVAFEYLQWWRVHNPSAEGCVPVLRMITSSLIFRGALLCFSLSLWPFAGLCQYLHIFLVDWSPELDPASGKCSAKRGDFTSLELLAVACLMQPRISFTFF